MQKAKTVDEYIAGAPSEVQGKLKSIRKVIKETAPDAEEKMSYGMPYYSYKGRLIYFAYAKNHIGVYPMPPATDQFKKELEPYHTSRATIQFKLDQKIPLDLLKKIVKARIRANEQAKKAK